MGQDVLENYLWNNPKLHESNLENQKYAQLICVEDNLPTDISVG